MSTSIRFIVCTSTRRGEKSTFAEAVAVECKINKNFSVFMSIGYDSDICKTSEAGSTSSSESRLC